MKLKEIKFNKIKVVIKKLPKTLGKNILLTFLGLLSIFLIFGAVLFYKYIFLVEKMEPDIPEQSIQFNEKLFQEILEKFEEKQQKLEETKTKEYPDPFARIIFEEEELTK